MLPVEVRKSLTDALKLDLVGPEDGLGNPAELLPEPPSRWYITGFIVPIDADETQKADEAAADELDQLNDAKGLDDAVAPDTAAAKRSFFPSSIGLSLLAKESTRKLQVA